MKSWANTSKPESALINGGSPSWPHSAAVADRVREIIPIIADEAGSTVTGLNSVVLASHTFLCRDVGSLSKKQDGHLGRESLNIKIMWIKGTGHRP